MGEIAIIGIRGSFLLQNPNLQLGLLIVGRGNACGIAEPTISTTPVLRPFPNSESKAAEEDELLQHGYRYALSLTNRHHDAQDLVQQGALRLYRSYGQIKNRAILFTTIRNLFYDQLRRSQVVAFDSLEEKDPHIVEMKMAVTETEYGDMEFMLGSLEPAEREIMFLHYVMGYTTREISKLTAKPRNTVLSLMSRSRKKLEELLTENPPPSEAEDGPPRTTGNQSAP